MKYLQLMTVDENSLSDGLKSSLQTFETALFLIALKRYPHALTTCFSAIEGGIKGILGERYNEPFFQLLGRAEKEVPSLKEHETEARITFRDRRNDFIHFGFSPKDDNVSVDLLLSTGFPILQKIYKGLHRFDLRSHFYKPARYHLDIAKKVREKILKNGETELAYSIESLGHWVYWYVVQKTTGWQDDAESSSLKWEYQRDRKEKLSHHFSPEWEFNCPICGDFESVVARFDYNDPNNTITISEMVCTCCDFYVPQEHQLLAETLLEEQVKQCSQQIIKEYGLDAS